MSLYLPLLPLQSLRPSWSDARACVVATGDRVIAVSALAMELGVRAGMRTGGVATLSPDIEILEQDRIQERNFLDSLVLALFQFTPEIAHESDNGLLLDIGPSLRLFGGAAALCRRVRACTTALGMSVVIGVAPTARAAWLLSRAPRAKRTLLRRRCLTLPSAIRLLDGLNSELLPSAWPFAHWLNEIGAHNLSDVRRLPRAGLIRRTSKQFIADLDAAYGDGTELFNWIVVPDLFSASVETFDRIEQAQALMVGATSLILQLIGWLTARQLAVAGFTLSLIHERGRAAVAPTVLDIRLAEPTWKEPHLLLLLKERLAKTELGQPVIGLRLEAQQLTPMVPPNDTLFPEPGGTAADVARLFEVLEARLGAENVLVPVPASDHRPECFNTWVPASTRAQHHKAEFVDDHPARPFWLLPKPIPLLMRGERPFYGSPLKILRGPERIEAGWWTDSTAVRDYYVAEAEDSTCYWIFLERTQNARWYLQGLFG